VLKEFDASFDRRIETRAMRSSSMGSTAMPQTGAMATVTKGLFQKSLRDIITGIRANKDRQKDYMNKCLQDIRAEVSVATFVFFAGVEPRRHARARAVVRVAAYRGRGTSFERRARSVRPNARRGGRGRRRHDAARLLGRSRQFSPPSSSRPTRHRSLDD
jgi:hypothetical protein